MIRTQRQSTADYRSLACARKVNHGSQSDDGAETRGVLMTVLHTLGACGADPCERLERALDAYAADYPSQSREDDSARP